LEYHDCPQIYGVGVGEIMKNALEMGILTSGQRDEWRSFASVSPYTTFYDTPEWTELLHAGYGTDPSFVWGLWVDGELAVIWPCPLSPTLGGYVCRPILATNCAPKLRAESVDADSLRVFTKNILSSVRRLGVSYWCFDIPSDWSFVKVAPRCGFRVSRSWRAGYNIELNENPDIVWNTLDGSTRTAVRKAKKEGLEVREAGELADFEAFLSIYQSTMRRRRAKEIRNPSSLASALNDLRVNGKVKLFVAADHSTIVAGAVFCVHKQVVHAWIGGSDQDSWKRNPNELVFWSAMEWACRAGLRTLDMGTASSNPNDGLTRFKHHLGAKPTDLTRLCLCVNRLKGVTTLGMAKTYRTFRDHGLVPEFVRRMLRKHYDE